MSGTLVILGGCGGIGRALVDAAGQGGWTPLVLDLPTSIAAHPLAVETVAVDATDRAQLEEAVRGVDEVRGFVNLCGFMGPLEPIAEQGAAQWDSLIEGNLTTAFHAAQVMAPKMAAGGAMVLTGSGLGHYARPGYAGYAVAKAGIAALTRQLALELAPKTRVNCVAPSAVDTAFLRGGTGRSDETRPNRIDREAYEAAIPLKRMAVAEDITGPMLFLLSEAAGYITGQVLHVNGGGYTG